MKKNKTQNKLRSAFTLIELLVVATIIIVLATMGLVSYRTAVKNSHQAKCESDLQAIRQALVMYRSENGSYPLPEGINSVPFSVLSDYLSSSDDFQPLPDVTYSYTGGGTTFSLQALGGDCAVTVTNP
jgi:type II secretory pathway pseudopilin PulG